MSTLHHHPLHAPTELLKGFRVIIAPAANCEKKGKPVCLDDSAVRSVFPVGKFRQLHDNIQGYQKANSSSDSNGDDRANLIAKLKMSRSLSR